jgi:hypothetical protein
VTPPPGGSHTTSGAVFEHLVVPALEKNGYTVSSQETVGVGLGGGKHRLDTFAISPTGDKIIISLKWQEVGGTTDEKVPFEVIKLLDLLTQFPEFARAYIILGGDGMRKRLETYYTDGSLAKWIVGSDRVKCLTLNQFIKACNRKTL